MFNILCKQCIRKPYSVLQLPRFLHFILQLKLSRSLQNQLQLAGKSCSRIQRNKNAQIHVLQHNTPIRTITSPVAFLSVTWYSFQIPRRLFFQFLLSLLFSFAILKCSSFYESSILLDPIRITRMYSIRFSQDLIDLQRHPITCYLLPWFYLHVCITATISCTLPLNNKGVVMFQLGLQAHCLLKLTIVIIGLYVILPFFPPLNIFNFILEYFTHNWKLMQMPSVFLCWGL